MSNPVQMLIDSALNMWYVAALGHNKIYTVTMSSGIMSTFAGGGGSSGALVGPATSVQMSGPIGVWKDRFGNVFVSEMTGQRLKKVNSGGIVSIFAGTGTSSATGASTSATIGDGGFPNSATFSYPNLGYADTLGYVYVA
eukprot:gene47501-biopygen34994